MSTSKKMKDFTSEPMGEKSVKSLAGIGEVIGDKLLDKVLLHIYCNDISYTNIKYSRILYSLPAPTSIIIIFQIL